MICKRQYKGNDNGVGQNGRNGGKHTIHFLSQQVSTHCTQQGSKASENNIPENASAQQITDDIIETIKNVDGVKTAELV